VNEAHEQVTGSGALRRFIGQRVLPVQDGHLESPFANVIIQGSSALAQEERQWFPVPERVTDRLPQAGVGLDFLLLQLLIHPLMQMVRNGLAMGLVMEQPLLVWQCPQCSGPASLHLINASCLRSVWTANAESASKHLSNAEMRPQRFLEGCIVKGVPWNFDARGPGFRWRFYLKFNPAFLLARRLRRILKMDGPVLHNPARRRIEPQNQTRCLVSGH